MLGHHKTYDGKGGYPLEFDNLNSKYKSAIDLISISDSIDAATDVLGRNYANGKNFYSLLDELNVCQKRYPLYKNTYHNHTIIIKEKI